MRYSERHPSKYVQASDLKQEGAVVTIDRVEMEEVGQKDKKEKPILYFKNASKALVLNTTNDRTITELFGDDDREWRGQQIELYPTTTQFGGKIVDCVRVRAVGNKDAEEPKPRSKKTKAIFESDLPEDLNDEIPF